MKIPSAIAAACLLAGCGFNSRHEVSLDGVAGIDELAVLEVSVAERLVGATSQTKLDYLVKGDAVWAIDLRTVDISRTAEGVTATVSPPRLVHPRVDMEGTRQYDASKGWFVSARNIEKARRELLGEAQRLVAERAGGERFRIEAEAQAEAVLAAMLGGGDVKIVWRRPMQVP